MWNAWSLSNPRTFQNMIFMLTFYFFFLPLIAAPLHPYSPTPQQPSSHSPCAPAPLRAQPLRDQPLRACSPAPLRACIATYFLLNLNG
ncbi:hypothetical protein ACOSQ2_014846 [Xanthoceras sorbifolium]